jgi:hypothetical protein
MKKYFPDIPGQDEGSLGHAEPYVVGGHVAFDTCGCFWKIAVRLGSPYPDTFNK